jgi:hypothetical protein
MIVIPHQALPIIETYRGCNVATREEIDIRSTTNAFSIDDCLYVSRELYYQIRSSELLKQYNIYYEQTTNPRQ